MMKKIGSEHLLISESKTNDKNENHLIHYRADLLNPFNKATQKVWAISAGRCDVYTQMADLGNWALTGDIRIHTQEYTLTIPSGNHVIPSSSLCGPINCTTPQECQPNSARNISFSIFLILGVSLLLSLSCVR